MSAIAGIAGVAAFAWLALFQVMLALGAPLGSMAWGGTHRVLPPRLRWASLASAGLAMLGGVAVAQGAALVPSVLPAIVIRPLLWALAVVFALSVLGNAASSSRVERLHGVPLALILALSCAVVAWTGGGA